MTWAEFRIRLHAYRRLEHNKMLKLRELAWITYISPNQDPKKMKKNIDAFWPLAKKVSAPTDRMREVMKEAQRQYLEDKENG